jgi:putative component of toxin-antitoxin plasmid stabilization module
MVRGHRRISDRLGTGLSHLSAKDGENLIVLFGGGTKKRQAADIARAKDLYAEYKARKRAASRPKGWN